MCVCVCVCVYMYTHRHIVRFIIPVVFITNYIAVYVLSNTNIWLYRYVYNLLCKEQLHVSALYIGHHQVEKWKNLLSSYTRLVCVVYSGEVRGGVGTRPGMCCVGWVVWVQGFCYCMLFYSSLHWHMSQNTYWRISSEKVNGVQSPYPGSKGSWKKGYWENSDRGKTVSIRKR